MSAPPIPTPSMLRWEPFFGNNRNKVPHEGIVRGGRVRILDHIGKPLSDLLWEDLVHRAQVRCIRIYTHDDRGEWCDGGDRAHIYLDKDGNVEDIHISFPMGPFRP